MYLVIGAGAAGIAAAKTLEQAGAKVKVLEARTRVGGRAFTARLEGFPVDLGAAWIHGTRNNPMAQLARSAGWRLQRTAHLHARVQGDTGELEQPARLFRAFFDWLSASEVEGLAGESLAHHLSRYLERLSPVPWDRAAFFARLMEQWLGASLDEISARYWNADVDLPGGDGLVVNGYGALVEDLATGLEIRFGWRVRRVISHSTGVRVEADDGRVEVADAVVVTLPLGVLKSGAVEFSPALSPSRRAVIERMGYGALEKVIAVFDRPFWGDAHHLAAVGPTPDAPWASVYPLTPYGQGAVLVAFTGGAGSRTLHRWSDAQVRESLGQWLSRFGRLPHPPRLYRTRWLQDPFALGSYSFPSVRSSPTDYDRLATPHTSRVLFAGEATSRAYPATVHGAYASGVREAQRLLERRARVA